MRHPDRQDLLRNSYRFATILLLLLGIACGRPDAPTPPPEPRSASRALPQPTRTEPDPERQAGGRPLWETATPPGDPGATGWFSVAGGPRWNPSEGLVVGFTWSADDATGQAWKLLRELSDRPDLPVGLAVRGRLRETGGETDLLITEVLAAMPGPACCPSLPGPGEWRAIGWEPVPWTVEVSPGGLVLRENGEAAPTRFPIGKSNAAANTWSFSSQAEGRRLRVVFEKRPCRSPDERTWHHLSARLLLDGEERRGCGLAGAELLVVSPKGRGFPTERRDTEAAPTGSAAGPAASPPAPTALKEALSRWCEEQGWTPRPPARVAVVDLDGDGRVDEALVLLERCDAGGCPLLIFESVSDEPRLISQVRQVRFPVLLADAADSELRDLYVTHAWPSGRRLVRLRFDGERYPLDPSQQPPAPSEALALAEPVVFAASPP